ncbi:hypothetical protein INR49_022880 [Caranx melampygus]|nr:hypothetical protein INR49_022880 [Caranx melampygus]
MEEHREEEEEEVKGGANSQETRGGIRCITEELLLKLSCCPPALCPSATDQHIKRLQVLNLNHNMIQRMERLNALTQLRELQLAHNHIQRIEGLEQLSSLQHLNLSYNRIDHVPRWLGRKLQSLHTLHLQHNLITSLYEVSRLRSLSALSELSVSGNPASLLPHSRLFLLYHLRTLDRLDDLPVTQEERGHAHQRFDAEELERLQREVDVSQSELSRPQGEADVSQSELSRLQGEVDVSQSELSRLQREVDLEKTTAELSRAFHRLYELEQELTFYKIDTKIGPLPPRTGLMTEVDSVTDSPYIGKARHISNSITSSRHSSSSSSSSSSVQGLQEQSAGEQRDHDSDWR